MTSTRPYAELRGKGVDPAPVWRKRNVKLLRINGYHRTMFDDADRIWNRACDPFAEHAAEGDRALQALLVVHGQVMNGGLASALEYKDPHEIQKAIGGFGYFALDHAQPAASPMPSRRLFRRAASRTQMRAGHTLTHSATRFIHDWTGWKTAITPRSRVMRSSKLPSETA